MKKTVLAIFLLILISSTGLFATGVGLSWNTIVDDSGVGTGDVAFLVSHDSIPGTILGVRLNSTDDYLFLGVFDDWWLYKTHLTGPLHLSLGLGGFVNMTSANETLTFDLGMRIPIDLRLFVLDPLEIFLEYAPTIGVAGLPDSVDFPNPQFGGLALGFRFWF